MKAAMLKTGIVLGTVILQKTVMPHLRIYGVEIQLAVPILLILSLESRRRRTVLISGFCIGLLFDFTGGTQAGTAALAYSITAYYLSGFPWSRIEQRLPFIAVGLFTATLLVHGILFIFQAREASAGYGVLLLRYGLPSAFLTLGFGLAVWGWMVLRNSGSRRKVLDRY